MRPRPHKSAALLLDGCARGSDNTCFGCATDLSFSFQDLFVPENILIIKPSSLGDVVHALPVLAKLKDTYPAARVSWLAGTAAAPLVENNPHLDRVHYFRREGNPVHVLRRGVGLARELYREDFDCAIDLQGLLRSALFTAATRAPLRVGLSNAREGAARFYTHRARVNPSEHAVDRYLEVGEILGFSPEDPLFELAAPGWAHSSVDRTLNAAGKPPRPYVALSPGARWRSKLWPTENFIDAGRLILGKFGGTLFLVGAEGEAGAAGRRIAAELGGGVVNLIGRTSLEEAIALLSKVDLLVTPDTGLMHVADALGLPLVAIFGPTDPGRTGPYLQSDHVVTADVCDERPCLERECPRGWGACEAMSAVAGRMVFERAVDILEASL